MDSLTEAKTGDFVALLIGYGHFASYRKERVEKVTPKFIILERHEKVKFKKDTGVATGESHGYITVITPAIQREWDLEQATRKMIEVVRDNKQGFSMDRMKQAIEILVKTSDFTRDEQVNFMMELLKLKKLSLESLQEAVKLFETETTP
jgi:hypothetical protein